MQIARKNPATGLIEVTTADPTEGGGVVFPLPSYDKVIQLKTNPIDTSTLDIPSTGMFQFGNRHNFNEGDFYFIRNKTGKPVNVLVFPYQHYEGENFYDDTNKLTVWNNGTSEGHRVTEAVTWFYPLLTPDKELTTKSNDNCNLALFLVFGADGAGTSQKQTINIPMSDITINYGGIFIAAPIDLQNKSFHFQMLCTNLAAATTIIIQAYKSAQTFYSIFHIFIHDITPNLKSQFENIGIWTSDNTFTTQNMIQFQASTNRIICNDYSNNLFKYIFNYQNLYNPPWVLAQDPNSVNWNCSITLD
jgi:hypothetical protein